MEKFKNLAPDYWEGLAERAENKRVTKSYQLIGLEMADLLDDREHKALYIRLAKNNDNQQLMGLAKRISTKTDVESKGAYFMRIWFDKEKK